VLERVGFIGLGAMGRPMARRLLAAGAPLVVQTRTAAHAHETARAGAEVVATPAAVAARCDVVCSCLLDSHAVRQVYLGPAGLLSAARPGQVLLEHGTFDPALARELGAAARSVGAAFLDAPVTGGPEGAAAGRLVTMVGGDPDALERARAVLDAYSHDVVHVGESGAGLQLKLVNQHLVTCHVAAAAEAAALVLRAGIPPETAERVLTSGWGASAMLARCLPRALGRVPETDGAGIGGLLAVQELVAALASGAGLQLDVLDASHRLLGAGVARGLAERDLAALAELFLFDPMQRSATQ
jgi:3-hydroxyisobutyrate dehydrogenase-like beta-hydroxyacid dehydrogenase